MVIACDCLVGELNCAASTCWLNAQPKIVFYYKALKKLIFKKSALFYMALPQGRPYLGLSGYVHILLLTKCFGKMFLFTYQKMDILEFLVFNTKQSAKNTAQCINVHPLNGHLNRTFLREPFFRSIDTQIICPSICQFVKYSLSDHTTWY